MPNKSQINEYSDSNHKSHLHGEVDAHEFNAWFQAIERWSHSESCKPSLLTKAKQNPV